jgi:hypothetical protein
MRADLIRTARNWRDTVDGSGGGGGLGSIIAVFAKTDTENARRPESEPI